MTGILFAATLGTALACGLVAGAFFAFSTFVMRALERLPADQGAAAMQSINVTVITPLFMLALIGSAVASVGLGVVAVARWGEPEAWWLLAGAVLYVAGTFGVTMAANVPLNDTLAALDPQTAEAATTWSSYLTDWTLWNHVRTAAALAAAAAFTVALASG